MNNPLLQRHKLPPFSLIKPEYIEPALDQILAESNAQIEKLLTQNTQYTWDNFIRALEDISDRISAFWSPISHMNSVVNSEALRAAYKASKPKLTTFYSELGQNEKLFKAYLHIKETSYQQLNFAQQKVIDNALRDFHLSGVDLNPQDKKRFVELESQLSACTTQFEENVLDATHAWHKHITDEKQLKGLPAHALAMARETALAQGKEGWVLTLEQPSYVAVITYADDHRLRQEIYTAYVTRASEQGPSQGKYDNSAVMKNILKLRHEIAQLLKFDNYAELSIAPKMASSTKKVLSFLHDLAHRSRDKGFKELSELQAFAKEHYNEEELNAWDIPYYSEKLSEYTFQFSQEDCRPYFPENRVLTGMFAVIEKLYGMRVCELKDIDTWHKDVRFFEVYDEDNKLRGQLYMDLYARPHKRGGAWMDECRSRRELASGEIQFPVAYLSCNFSGPTENKPALFTHDEVITLFHEFGHTLHHILTQVNYPEVSGINGVPWDAVELPSQFMEEWCWQQEAINLISGHYESGEPLPAELLKKMLAGKLFHVALQMLRQLEFSIFDFRLHKEFDPAQSNQVQEILDQVRDQVAIIIPPAFNRFQHGFTHIFSGGYAAGYYSYKWAEVLSCDAFSLFEENGIFDKTTGRAFLKNILEMGGSRDPETLFIAFRGREPKIDALLKQSGIRVK